MSEVERIRDAVACEECSGVFYRPRSDQFRIMPADLKKPSIEQREEFWCPICRLVEGGDGGWHEFSTVRGL